MVHYPVFGGLEVDDSLQKLDDTVDAAGFVVIDVSSWPARDMAWRLTLYGGVAAYAAVGRRYRIPDMRPQYRKWPNGGENRRCV